ncbi:YwmB family TATA-box binding protein [Fredinandcohnia sp. 179-A 10B2 NHS]|uniref:YwmB family TATA-box binding protein n=1 Tax=Fredinandcohnia sp. 179-A 10B2 NHS TaxID=3235176 RepID=UPI0039A10F52
MKLTIPFLLSLGLVVGFFSNSETEITKEQNDLETLNQVAVMNEIKVESWIAFSRTRYGQATDKKEMLSMANELMASLDEYTWRNVVEDDDHYIWQGERVTNEGIKEKLKLKAYVLGSKYELSTTLEAKGELLEEDQLDWVKKTFKEDESTFYSVTGKIQSTNELSNLTNNLITDVNGKMVEQLLESEFVSVSAYSDVFETELRTANNELINMQIGLRTSADQNHVDVTIGTPIITTEY